MTDLVDQAEAPIIAPGENFVPASSRIRVIDFEANGLDASAKIIESAYTDFDFITKAIDPHGSSFHFATSNPPEARAVNHIWMEDIAHAPAFDAEAFVGDAVASDAVALAAHNMTYEAQFIQRHVEGAIHMICTMKSAMRVWPECPTFSNFGLGYWLIDRGLISVDRALVRPPHRAGPDTVMTAHILKALFESGCTGQQLVSWTRRPAAWPTCPIGEHRGKPWGDVPKGFLDWMVNKATGMDPDYVWCARRELDRRKAS